MALGSVNVPAPQTDCVKTNQVGAASGVAPLDENKKVPDANLPAISDQAPTYTAATELAALVSGEKLSVAFGKIAKAVTDLISHLANKANPHGVDIAAIFGSNITSLDALATAMGGAKIQTGSYTGTGTYGSSNPCSLTFDFVPQLFTLFSSNGQAVSNNLGTYHLNVSQLTTTYKSVASYSNGSYNYGGGEDYTLYMKKSSDGKTLFWYVVSTYWEVDEEAGETIEGTQNSATEQCNKSGTTYLYAAQ